MTLPNTTEEVARMPRIRRGERSFRVASWNSERDHAPDLIARDFRRIVAEWRPEILGVQEAAAYLDVLDDAADSLEYGLALPVEVRHGGRGRRMNPILFDRRALVTASRLPRVIPVHGAKAGQYPERNVTTASFVWVAGDGTVVTAANTHANSRVEKAGRPRDLPRVRETAEHFEDLARITAAAAEGAGVAFLTGDLNVDEDADNRVRWHGFPDRTFARHGIVSVYDELDTPASFDTHGSRKIDVVASVRRDERVRALRVDRMPSRRLATGHAAVCATYAIRLR